MSEKPKSSVAPWAVTGLFFLVCIVLLFNPRTETVVREVEKPVSVDVYRTNEVIKEVERRVEVPQIVEVPAQIPIFYLYASNFFVRYYAAELSSNIPSSLKGLTNVSTAVVVSKHFSDDITEDEVKTRFELTLRKNGIPINAQSPYNVTMNVDGFWNDDSTVATYNLRLELTESTVLFRGDAPQQAYITSWQKGSFGFAGKQRFHDTILDSVQARAEAFANEYLEQNPK